jgi:NTE family protein
VRTGNFAYFDSTKQRIGPEHILASGALPPGFPAIEIEGEHYWDGGLVSNTPLQWVLQFGPGPRRDTLAFEVDLWSARGRFPRNIVEVATREKEIRYSSRTRDNTDRFEDIQRIRHAVAKLIAELPPGLTKHASVAPLEKFADHKVYNIVHLIYRSRAYEGITTPSVLCATRRCCSGRTTPTASQSSIFRSAGPAEAVQTVAGGALPTLVFGLATAWASPQNTPRS